MEGTVKSYLGVLGIGLHILSGLFALGLAVDFVWALLKRDLSPWWFWPTGIIATLVLIMIAGNLLRLVDNND